MYNAEMFREETKEGRTFQYYKVNRENDNRFVGCMIRVTTGDIEHWYVDAEMNNPKVQPCRDVQSCFKRLFKSWKKRGGSLAKE